MPVLNLTDLQLRNLVIFMGRAKMEGDEAFGWVELMQLIQKAKEVEVIKPTEK